jgi:hypothetical protein
MNDSEVIEKLGYLEAELTRLKAKEEICNLMGHYEVLHNQKTMGLHPMDFALTKQDVSISVSGKFFYGPDEVKKLFCEVFYLEEYHGIMLIHYLTTPMIEVAEDGKTARGVWWSPGIETVKEKPGSDPVAYWCFGAYANDFILENGTWKIWHMRWSRVSKCNYKLGWVDAKIAIDENYEKQRKENPLYNPFHLGYIQEALPMPPLPYKTWNDEKWYLREEKWDEKD